MWNEPKADCRLQNAELTRGFLRTVCSLHSAVCLWLALLPLLLLPSACVDQTADARALAAGVVDSLLPIDEEIRRFRISVPEVPERLAGGENSRDALVKRWIGAIEQGDSLALRRMHLTAAEFITFYYPESQYTRPPYRQKPSLRWFLMTSGSSQGAGRVWQRHAGRSLGFLGYQCAPEPQSVGASRIWSDCVVRLRSDSGDRRLRLFGPILERDGEFKFLSYASDY